MRNRLRKGRSWALALVVLLLAVAAMLPLMAAGERLPGLGIDPSGTSVSGLSSGGYMAVQFHVSHSSSVQGVGVIAGGPYYCAQGSALTASYNCMEPSAWMPLPPVPLLITITDVLARGDQIDPATNLANARVWLFSGARDDTVVPKVMDALKAYYLHWVPEDQLTFVNDVQAGHAMVTADYGAACGLSEPPYINDCDFDAAGALLQHVYGTLVPPTGSQSGDLIRFEQGEFVTGSAYKISMDDAGFVYIPRACRAGGCRVHVVFHGCGQGRYAVGDQFVLHAGYNRWADDNRLVILYPQAISRYGWGPWPWPTSFVLNPGGCWDWWGYTGSDYATKSGAQIRAVQAMLDRLAEPAVPKPK